MPNADPPLLLAKPVAAAGEFFHPALDHIGPEARESYPDDASPSMEVLRPYRAAEPAAEQLPEEQPPQPAELTKEQIKALIKQIPQLDISKIADKVARELERRMQFERQRRGM
jgi:hypothetical protein